MPTPPIPSTLFLTGFPRPVCPERHMWVRLGHIGKCRIVACLCRRGFLAGEDIEGHVAAGCVQPVVQLTGAIRRKPAALARGNQDRAFDVSSNPAEDRFRDHLRIPRRDAIPQERFFMHIPPLQTGRQTVCPAPRRKNPIRPRGLQFDARRHRLFRRDNP